MIPLVSRIIWDTSKQISFIFIPLRFRDAPTVEGMDVPCWRGHIGRVSIDVFSLSIIEEELCCPISPLTMQKYDILG